MSKIYLPSEYVNKPCKIVNNEYIRVYDTINVNQSNVVYDIYVKQDYMIKKSTANYNNNTICDTLNTYTNDWYYRTDFFDILGCILILSIFAILVPGQIFFHFFKRSGMNL